jgi:hypothetical protein
MHVLRHADVRPEIKRVLLPGSIDRFDEPQAASVFRMKRTPTKQENVSEWAWPGSPSRRHVLRWPFIETDASQGAARTISGYDILPRIQGHAHAKPWAWHPAKTLFSAGAYSDR